MSDPRFARLKKDPRFRRIRKKSQKVVVDDRFKGVCGDEEKKKTKGQVDKYGRKLAKTHEADNLRRFYRLEDEDEEDSPKVVDFARGEVLMESSDEDEGEGASKAEESDEEDDGVITLGRDETKSIAIPDDDEEAEIDLDEDNFADLDAQAAATSRIEDEEDETPVIDATRRIAIVNLDWDHVRATHLWKIISSVLSSTTSEGSKRSTQKLPARGRLLSVRVYPSEFGKERMEREQKEGPPPEVFKKKAVDEDEDEEEDVIELGQGDDYDEDALRRYQLDRMRYYYAIAEFDSVQAASHVFSELEGAELERSANVFDLSYVPDGMTFDEECRDEANDDSATAQLKGLDFVTDALRHSKVKLTWDEDDPERNRITRRALSKQEIEEADFKALFASSESESEAEAEATSVTKKDRRAAERDKLRALLLGGNDDAMPEGWGATFDDKEAKDVDMEVTFAPGFSTKSKGEDEETTLDKYQRKMKEKRKKRKEESKTKEEVEGAKTASKGGIVIEDDFFGQASEDEEGDGDEPQKKRGKDKKNKKGARDSPAPRVESTAEELALLTGGDDLEGGAKHFDMKAVLKAEKKKGKKAKKSKKGKLDDEGPDETQEDFAIDVKDDRFSALHEDHTFAIDPSNPHFKKTKSMSALLEEGAKRRKTKAPTAREPVSTRDEVRGNDRNLQKLVESVKRRSTGAELGGGKRRRL